MSVRSIFVLALVVSSRSADHSTFKDCGRINFCSRLRDRPQIDNYMIDAQSITPEESSTTIRAIAKSKLGNVDLNITVTALQQDTFRIKITESNSNRYELRDVLDGEPQPVKFDNINTEDGKVTATTASGANSVVINFSPFKIEFRKDDVSEVVFNGDRLSMLEEYNEAPFTFGVTFPQAVQLYGLHEHCHRLALPTTASTSSDPFRLKNSDVAYYEIESPMALYGAVPVLYGHGAKATSGVFLHNAAEQWVDLTNSNNGTTNAYFMAESGSLDLFVLLGPRPEDVVRQYTSLTGPAALPQLWTLGYHQSRYSYDGMDDVLTVAAEFDEHYIQLDSIWLDIDYTDGFKYFTWNPVTYPDPVGMQQTVAGTNKKIVTIIDPHIKAETGYWVYDGALARDLFVKEANGSVFVGPCWPGASTYMDFLNPDAREYYGSQYSFANFVNTTSAIGGIWNDMNEPSVFDNSIEMTLPADSLHYGGVRHHEIHNIYGFLHTIATYEGLLARDEGKLRPFVLTRSHFAGSQRYAAIWTGDNQASWPYLLASFQTCLNANLLGLVFCGADVGGFFGDPSDELLQRWYQAGAWLPFYRSHSTKESERREPYLKPIYVQGIIRYAIQMRYSHLPVWYTLFYEHTKTGAPLIRPLFYHYPEDQNVYKIDDHLLVGRDILVRPVTEPGVSSVEVYFPGGNDEIWVSATDNGVYRGNGYEDIPVGINNIPVYYRAGAAVLRKDAIRRNSVEMQSDPFVIYYTLDENNSAHGVVYLDDHVSFEYRDSSDFNYMHVLINGTTFTFWNDEEHAGKGNFEFRVEFIVQRRITQRPRAGVPGIYQETIHSRDALGSSLKDIKFNPKQRTVLRL